MASTDTESTGSTRAGDYVSKVLDVAELIPAGRVMSYGDIAEYVGQGGPRQVGRVMALWGGGVPWWRVVHSDGRFLDGHEREAIGHYRREGTPLRTGTDGRPSRINMRQARWTGTGTEPESEPRNRDRHEPRITPG